MHLAVKCTPTRMSAVNRMRRACAVVEQGNGWHNQSRQMHVALTFLTMCTRHWACHRGGSGCKTRQHELWVLLLACKLPFKSSASSQRGGAKQGRHNRQEQFIEVVWAPRHPALLAALRAAKRPSHVENRAPPVAECTVGGKVAGALAMTSDHMCVVLLPVKCLKTWTSRASPAVDNLPVALAPNMDVLSRYMQPSTPNEANNQRFNDLEYELIY